MRKVITTISLFLFLIIFANAQDVTFAGAAACNGAAVSGSWVVPCGVTSISVVVHGGGGGAGGGGGGSNGGFYDTRGGGGGGGGGYTTSTFNVTPGSSFSYSVGAGGCGGTNGSDANDGGNGTAGGNSTFSGTNAGGTPVNLAANGGTRGTGGDGSEGSPGSGGAGGSASGGTTNTSGIAGSNGSGGNGGAGGAGAGPSGGAGGATTAAVGATYGGAGAGGGNSAGGRGAPGAILITYVTSTPIATPTVSSIPATCATSGSSTISNYDGTKTYTFTPTGPTAGAGGIISGMVTGTSYTVTAGASGCNSLPSAAFSNSASTPPPAIPTITSTAPTCLAGGSSTISNYVAPNTYSFTPAGPTAGAGGTITGMVTGTNYTVIASDGSCTSTPSSAFSNAAQLTIPSTPTITTTPPTCSGNGSSTINNYNALNTYQFTPAGPTTSAGGAISGMVTSTSYTVLANNGTCNSIPSTAFSNAAQLPIPAIPSITTTPPTCSADGSSTINNYNASNTYTFIPTGPTTGAGGAISGMTIGTNYTVSASDGTCNSTASTVFSNAAQLPTPTIPSISTTPPTCTANGSSTISNYNASNTYSFTPAGPTVTAGGAINNMVVGTSYTVAANDGTCNSTPSVAFSNSALTPPPSDPTISSTPPTCSADGSSLISNYNASLTYIFTPSAPTVGAGGAISGMAIGTSYTVLASDGSCSSAPSVAFSNSVQLTTPANPTISNTPPTCVADGSSSVTNYDATVTYLFTPAGPSVSAGGAINGMTLGTSYTLEASNGTCNSLPSASFSNGALTPPPSPPTISSTPPSCSADGSSTISNYVSTLTYIFTPTGPTVDASGNITGMATGTSYTVEASDGSCTSSPSTSFSNSPQLPTPVAVIAGLLTYCTGGNTTLTASGGANYAWTDASATNIGNSASLTVTQGDYTVVATDANGCTATTTASVNESSSLAVTITGNLTYCPGGNTTLTATGGTGFTWSDGSTSASITATQNTYSVTATDASCSGTASAIVTQIATTPLNLGSNITECEDSLVSIDAGSGYTQYLWSSGETTQTILPQSSGDYSVTATDANTCTVSSKVNVLFKPCPVVKDFTAYIPNAFTPNNDGNNDVFRCFFKDIKFVEIKVFNRWGEKVFSTNIENEGWDGTYKYQKCTGGVYVYYINLVGLNGKAEEYKGTVTLVR